MAKGAGRGLANKVTAEEEAELNAMAMLEFVNAVTAQNNAQMEKMMELFKSSLSELSNKQPGVSPNTTFTHQKCPHCKLRHPNPDGCWELEKNASKRPKNWKPAAERKKKSEEAKVKSE
eukprot:scaffold53544_cov39-Cyclotella_meneghiniana.AAC.6